MAQFIAAVALVVPDYDEAIAYYTAVLGFELIEDSALSEGKRWVLIAPPGSHGTRLLLARAATPAQMERVGDQTGGRVFLFLYTDDFYRDYALLSERGVEFVEVPREESYAIVVVFRDRYGNRWDLIQPRSGAQGV